MEWLGFSHRATVNFGTLSQTAKPNKVTRSDVTKLPEMATSVYGGGARVRDTPEMDCFFGFPHEHGSAWRGWGSPIGQGLISGQCPKIT